MRVTIIVQAGDHDTDRHDGCRLEQRHTIHPKDTMSPNDMVAELVTCALSFQEPF